MILTLTETALPHWLTLVYIFVGIGALLAIVLTAYYAVASQRPRDFPPGPPTLPVLGNLHLFPRTKSCLKFHEWGKEYGSIIGLKLGPQNVVILNDYKHVQELLDKKGTIYSDRPVSHIASDLIFKDETHILFARYGDGWKVLRKTYQVFLNMNAVDQLWPLQIAEVNQTMHQIMTNPERWYHHIRRFSSGIALASIYGLRGESFDSPRVEAFYHAQDQMTQITEIGATPPVDVFPFLKYLPNFLASWRSWAAAIRSEHQIIFKRLRRESELQAERDSNVACLMSRMINDREKHGLDDEHITYFCSTLMEAASDTTSSTILSFVLAMAKHPDALAKCHEEVDRICGTDRSPGRDDFKHFVYLKAAMKEVLRWRPVLAAGAPHALTQDDYYQGYYLPKGTIVIPNTWSIHRTEEFADADDFRPERFLNNKFGIIANEDGQNNETRRSLYAFGAGRRICAGQRMAEHTLIAAMAKLVWSFDITPETDMASIDDSLETGYFGGIAIAPKQFPVKLTPRSDAHARVIADEYAISEEFLSKFNFKE